MFLYARIPGDNRQLAGLFILGEDQEIDGFSHVLKACVFQHVFKPDDNRGDAPELFASSGEGRGHINRCPEEHEVFAIQRRNWACKDNRSFGNCLVHLLQQARHFPIIHAQHILVFLQRVDVTDHHVSGDGEIQDVRRRFKQPRRRLRELLLRQVGIIPDEGRKLF